MSGIDYSLFKFAKPDRLGQKLKRRSLAKQQQREAYAAVTARDGHSCRVCRRWTNPAAIDPLERGEHHHLRYRSLGGEDTTDNLVLLCASCHREEHKHAIRLSGHADRRMGVKLERLADDGWRVERWI